MKKIRAHHLLCIPRFYSGGYDNKFAENMGEICLGIRKNPDMNIKVIKKCDDICDKCPYLFKNKCIQSEKVGKWVISQDKKILKYLKLGENSTYKAKDVFSLSMEKINPKTIKKICKDCIFLKDCLKVGINNSFRKDINKKSK